MATFRLCSIPNCGKRHKGHGYCRSHLSRWRRYGDPLAGNARPGDLLNWIEKHVEHGGNDCLIWPFGVSSGGYGSLIFQGRRRNAHNVMCRLAHGKPSSSQDAAHACGNRLCCNPRHLRWASRSANHLDKRRHGTDTGGERNVAKKLTANDVREIRERRRRVSQRALARQFGVDQSIICRKQNRLDWASVN